MKYLFDTNIFNDILDERIDITNFKDEITCCVTHLQKSEINKTQDSGRRHRLNELFHDLQGEEYVLETLIFDVSLMDHDKWGDGVLYKEIYDRLNKLNRKKKSNNHLDALLGEVALKNGLTLVTHDMELYKAMSEFKCPVSNIYQVLKNHRI